MQRWATAAVVAGLVLMVLSGLWSYLSPDELVWDEQDQRDYEVVAERLHQAGHGLERAEQSRSSKELETAQAELAAALQASAAEQDRLARAQAGLTWIPRLLFWSGAIATVGGLLAYRRGERGA